MSKTIVCFVGSQKRPARARYLVEIVAERLRSKHELDVNILDLVDAGLGLCAVAPADLDSRLRVLIQAIERADGLIVGCPVFQGSYPGLFKHVFDLVDPTTLRNRPVLLTAVGGGLRHSLVVEHQLRPLFGFFEASTIPTAVYACADELRGDGDLPELLNARICNAAAQFAAQINNPMSEMASLSKVRSSLPLQMIKSVKHEPNGH